jgi:hypothetical protein
VFSLYPYPVVPGSIHTSRAACNPCFMLLFLGASGPYSPKYLEVVFSEVRKYEVHEVRMT